MARGSVVEGRPRGPQHLAERRWLGFKPRTVIVVGVCLVVVMLAEYVWLYSPFGGGSTTRVDSTATATTDSVTDATGDPNADPNGGSSGSDVFGSGGATATYVALGNVFIRSTPGRTGTEVGRLPKGTRVEIACTTLGDPVKGATRTDSHWDKITYNGVTGYVTNTLMATGAAIDNPQMIPPC